VALVSVAGWFIYRQALDAGAIIGITLIVVGVIVLRLFSKTVTL
jgi:small multidrug resistance pump